MTEQPVTHIVIVADRSGSMEATRSDAEGGLKALLKEQEGNPGTTLVSLYQFDNEFEPFYEQRLLSRVPEWKLSPRGGTALYDAIGLAVKAVGEQDEKAVLVVLTDGEENASAIYSGREINELLAAKKAAGWTVVFVGADQDAFKAGADLGVSLATTLSHSGGRTRMSYHTTGTMISRGTRSGLYAYTDEERDATA